MIRSPVDTYLFEPPPLPAVPVQGEFALFPVHRVFCVGRNYVEHAREMGVEVDREKPFYFLKPATAVVISPAIIPYPPGTSNFHYEMELVVAIGSLAFEVERASALDAVLGYACGLDMTRRDLQLEARAKGRPWDTGKAVEHSAILAPIVRRDAFGELGDQAIQLEVNGGRRQDARLSDLVWSVPEIVADLSRLYHLGPGDLIFTGTPAGVGPVESGDHLRGHIDGAPDIELRIADADTTPRHVPEFLNTQGTKQSSRRAGSGGIA